MRGEGFRPTSHPGWWRREQTTWPKETNGKGQARFALMRGRYDLDIRKGIHDWMPIKSLYPTIRKSIQIQGAATLHFKVPRPRRIRLEVRSSQGQGFFPRVKLQALPTRTGRVLPWPFRAENQLVWISGATKALYVSSKGFQGKEVPIPPQAPNKRTIPLISVLLSPKNSFSFLRILGNPPKELEEKPLIVSAYPKNPMGENGRIYHFWQRSFPYKKGQPLKLEIPRKGPIYIGIFSIRLKDGRRISFKPIQPVWMEGGQELKFEAVTSKSGR